jgi:hypothetical protein
MPDRLKRLFGSRLACLWQPVQDTGRFMHPAVLLAC